MGKREREVGEGGGGEKKGGRERHGGKEGVRKGRMRERREVGRS